MPPPSRSRKRSRLARRGPWQVVPSFLSSHLFGRIGPWFGRFHQNAWPIILAGAVVVLILGAWGFATHLASPRQANGMELGFWNVVYLTLQLFTLESGAVSGHVPWQLEVARFLGPFVALGALLRVLATLVFDGFQLFLLRLFGSGHIVVCGLGQKGAHLVDELRRRGNWVVVIESDPSNPGLDRCRERGATVIQGSATDLRTLGAAQVVSAEMLVVVMGTDDANVETAARARDLCANRDPRYGNLRCILHVRSRKLRERLLESEIVSSEDDPFELELFNVFEMCARIMLRETASRLVLDDGKPPHLLVVGFGQLGEAVTLRAAKDWIIDGRREQLRITVIDRNAGPKGEDFRARYPELAAGCVLDFLPVDIYASKFDSGGALPADATCAYVCFGDDALALYAALTLGRLWQRSIPIIARMTDVNGLATAMRSDDRDGSTDARPARSGIVRGVRPVCLLDITCNADLVTDGANGVLARAIHQGYVEYHRRKQSIERGDMLVTWDQLPSEARRSNLERVRHLDDQLRSVGCKLVAVASRLARPCSLTAEQIENLASAEHQRWLAERLEQGWTYAPSRDPERKRNPNLQSWNEAPPSLKQENREAVAELPRILAKADYEIAPI